MNTDLNSTAEGKKIGVISDTHGVLHADVIETLKGVEMILHAGDVGRPEVLEMLGDIAPVIAVRGNVDHGDWARELREREVIEIGEMAFYMIHDLHRLDLDPAAAGFKGVIYGHSHRPSEIWKEGVLYLNPGSAGPGRFTLPASLALMNIGDHGFDVQFVSFERRKGLTSL